MIYFLTEMWYLVCYEDDNNLRVLGSDELRHIFPEDDADDGNDDFQIDDIVSAIWLPNGKFYDAKILQKGGMFPHCEIIQSTVKCKTSSTLSKFLI